MVIDLFAFFWGIGQTIAVALAYAFYQTTVVSLLTTVLPTLTVVGDTFIIRMDPLF